MTAGLRLSLSAHRHTVYAGNVESCQDKRWWLLCLSLTVGWVLLASKVCPPRSLLTPTHEPQTLDTAHTPAASDTCVYCSPHTHNQVVLLTDSG
jgi:hypothetical protein